MHNTEEISINSSSVVLNFFRPVSNPKSINTSQLLFPVHQRLVGVRSLRTHQPAPVGNGLIVPGKWAWCTDGSLRHLTYLSQHWGVFEMRLQGPYDPLPQWWGREATNKACRRQRVTTFDLAPDLHTSSKFPHFCQLASSAPCLNENSLSSSNVRLFMPNRFFVFVFCVTICIILPMMSNTLEYASSVSRAISRSIRWLICSAYAGI